MFMGVFMSIRTQIRRNRNVQIGADGCGHSIAVGFKVSLRSIVHMSAGGIERNAQTGLPDRMDRQSARRASRDVIHALGESRAGDDDVTERRRRLVRDGDDRPARTSGQQRTNCENQEGGNAHKVQMV